jgi:hypothetical protein
MAGHILTVCQGNAFQERRGLDMAHQGLCCRHPQSDYAVHRAPCEPQRPRQGRHAPGEHRAHHQKLPLTKGGPTATH